MLLLPHHHEFAETLANLPFFYQKTASETCEIMHIIQKDPCHLPEVVNANRLEEYLLSGEMNEFVEFVDGYANNADESESGNNSWELGDEWLGSI